jgi:hypothetical protein
VTAANQQVQQQVLYANDWKIDSRAGTKYRSRKGKTIRAIGSTDQISLRIQSKCNLAFDRNKTQYQEFTGSPFLAEFANDKRVERDEFQSSWSTGDEKNRPSTTDSRVHGLPGTTILYPSTSTGTGVSTEVGASPQSFNMSTEPSPRLKPRTIVRSLCS